MRNRPKCGALLLITASLHPTQSPAEPGPATPDQIVSALEATFGNHAGQRRNHAKGTCAAGKFVGLPAVQEYTRSTLFSGTPLAVIARFSLPGGNPDTSDATRSPRGLALEISAGNGVRQHMTMLNTPMFGASTPATFLADIVAKRPDPMTGKPNPETLRAFRASHPDSVPQFEFLQRHNPPPSWTQTSYFGIHTFKFVDRGGTATLVRWRFVPRDGQRELSNDELLRLPPSFLEQRLLDRVAHGPVLWDMILTIGEPGDPETDPTKLWPEHRKEIKAGTLTLSSAAAQEGAACQSINFDPLVLTEGIEPTNDPVLLARSPTYALSFGKRISGR